jgi:archaemetzincin
MKPRQFLRLLLTLVLVIPACQRSPPPAKTVFVIQPFIDIPSKQVDAIYNGLKKIHPKTILRIPMPLPAISFYSARNRYRADSIIHYLGKFAGTDTVILALTSRDISATKGNIADWGIMGLGFQPGNACVVSTFRLSKVKLSDQLYKLSLHELGHTQGLLTMMPELLLTVILKVSESDFLVLTVRLIRFWVGFG